MTLEHAVLILRRAPQNDAEARVSKLAIDALARASMPLHVAEMSIMRTLTDAERAVLARIA